MKEQTVSELVVEKTIIVQAPIERAFSVFTEGLTSWWPLDSHHIGAASAVAAVMEPREGGRWYERGEDGTECDWGRVLAWDPPHRVVLAWMISADWVADPDVSRSTEIDVRFTAEGPSTTRVDLQHGKLERFGDRATEMQGIFSSDGGWNLLLAGYSAAV
jgi:uncharacterized protein YndB with AHSA1/START domain